MQDVNLRPAHCSSARAVRRRGFTLIELLVVIAIIAILVAILLPALAMAKGLSIRLREMAAANQLMVAYHAYAADHQDALLLGVLPDGWILGPSPIRPRQDDGRRFGPFKDAAGNELNVNTAARYPWRLAPWLDYELRTLVVDDSLRRDMQTRMPDAPDQAVSWQRYVGEYPSFGINAEWVGGDPKTLNNRLRSFVVHSIADIQRPSMLLVFASARGEPDFFDGGSVEIRPGFNFLKAPFGVLSNNAYARPDFAWDPKRGPADYGFLDLRYDSKAVCAQADGHVEMLGLPLGGNEQLRDMRRWCNAADVARWRPPTP